jgi:hypothetical protein
MKNEIEAILSGITDKAINQVGHLWQIRVGGRAGARVDGIGLARELLQEHVSAPIEEAPVQVGQDAEPEPIEIPRFLAPDPLEGIPDQLRALAEPGETVAAMQARLWVLWRELNGKLMLNLAGPEEIALHGRLHNQLHWIAPPLEGDE